MLLDVLLKKLRESFSLNHKSIPQHLLEGVKDFKRIPFNPKQFLFIYDKDGGLLAC
jgi:hypothetical protein